MAWLAEKAKHLTPESMGQEYRKLERSVRLIVVHIKPAFYDQVTKELSLLNLPDLEVSQPNREYEI